MPGCIVSATTASFRSVEKRRRRAMPVITSTFENVSDIGVCLGLCLGPPANAGVRSKRGAVQWPSIEPTRRLALSDYAAELDASAHANYPWRSPNHDLSLQPLSLRG